MLIWLIAVAACVAIWGAMWQSNLALSFGILVGLILAWLGYRLMTPYVTGMEDVPVWLPPLPMATVAVILLVYGALIWIRGNEALPKPKPRHDEHGSHGHH